MKGEKMSVTDKEILDGIGISKNNPHELGLFLSDHLDWENECEHLMLLQDKINAYITFWESAQYKEIYNDINFDNCVIEIHFLFEPTLKALQFISVVEKQISEIGMKIKYAISGEDERNKFK